MKKLRTILLFVFIGVGIVNFLGVSYFKKSNIQAFKNYIEFCYENENTLKKLETSPEMKDIVEQITGTYYAFQEKGIKDPAVIIAYHTQNVRKGAPVISNYYQLYKMGKIYDQQVEKGKSIIESRKN